MKVSFDTKTMPPAQSACRCCGGREPSAICWVNPEGGNPDLLPLYAYKCQHCMSVYFDGEDPVLGYENESFSDGYWRHYAQVGAGITAMLEPLFALKQDGNVSWLDVGCGFGYVVDFWNKTQKGSAVGLETAAYGRIGKSKLNVPIIPAYLSDAEEIKDSVFDIVYASEVLEHIKAPFEFIKEISTKLSDKGVLVLTTPSADAISSENNESSVIASLSPYFHYFISSENNLVRLLEHAGFSSIRVHNANGRLFAWASNSSLPELDIGRIDWSDYFSYLSLLSQNEDKNVACGALYRLFKDALNTGRVELSRDAFTQLENKAQKCYGLSFQYPEIQRYLDRQSAVNDLETNPAWYGCSLLFGGILVGHMLDDRRRKLRLIDAGEKILRHEAASTAFRQFAQEAEHFAPYAAGQLVVAAAEFLDQQLQEPAMQKLVGAEASLESPLRSIGATLSRVRKMAPLKPLASRIKSRIKGYWNV